MARAEALSPLDPLLCAMQSCNAIAYLQEGKLHDSARLAVTTARAPQAHIVIQASAVAATWLVDERDAARHWVKVIMDRGPDATVAWYQQALPFANGDFSRMIGAVLERA